MYWVVWCALWAVGATLEYGARLPEYGGPARAQPADYRDHPAPLVDYDDDYIGKPKPVRKQTQSDDDELGLEDFVKIDSDDDTQRRSTSRHHTKHHLRRRNYERSYRKSRKVQDRSNREIDLENEEIRIEDKHDKDIAIDKDRYAYRIPRVGIQRRPGEKHGRRGFSEDDMDKGDESQGRDMNFWKFSDEDTRPQSGAAPARPAHRDRIEDMFAAPLKNKNKVDNYGDNYDDYYNLKNMKMAKSSPPTIMRRTQTRLLVPEPPQHPFSDLLSNRRLLPEDERPFPEKSVTVTTTVATTSTTISSTTTKPSTTTTATKTTSKTKQVDSNPSELSLAEKSRLSILKKAQRKENVREKTKSSKPPVLLHMTKKLPTVVMVEPPPSMKPWARAQLVSGDSPRRLQKVKRLMRQKLLAGARSIHDLTDDWDALVCDYIDMSLVDNCARASHATPTLIASTLVLIFG